MGERMTPSKPRATGVTPSLLTRLCAIVAVLAAPLAPPLHREGRGRAVMIVVDRSDSVGGEGRDAAGQFVRAA
jgi:hypothetical protein